jgi:hypothetical protein
LAWFYAAVPSAPLRNGLLAVQFAELAVARSPDANTLDTLACAYARIGDFAKARAAEARVAGAPLLVTLDGSRPPDRMAEFSGPAPKACVDERYGISRLPFRTGTQGRV